LYRDIHEFKNGYQRRTNIVKDNTVTWWQPPHSILDTGKKKFLSDDEVHLVNVLKTEIHAAECLVPQPSAYEVEIAIEKLKTHTNVKVLIKFQQK